MAPPRPLRVLMPMHPGFDVMDYFGPMEVLSLAKHVTSSSVPDSLNVPHVFEITTTAVDPVTTSEPGAKVLQGLSIKEAYRTLDSFDVLVIPGGSSQDILDNANEPMDLIRAFWQLPRRTPERIIMSVCTGALLLAKAGVLAGKTAITNSQDLDRLRALTAACGTTVAEKGRRFVVNLPNPSHDAPGHMIMTSAGPGAGLDLSLWLVEHCAGENSRRCVEELFEYEGQLKKGLIVS